MDCGITVAAWIRLGRFDNFPYFCMKVLLLMIFVDDWMKIKLNSNLSNFLFSGTLTRRGHWRQPLEVCWCPVLLWTLSPEWPSCPPLCTLREDSSGGINLSLFKKFWFTNCSILETWICSFLEHCWLEAAIMQFSSSSSSSTSSSTPRRWTALCSTGLVS